MGPEIPCVTSDNFAGGQLAAEKLDRLYDCGACVGFVAEMPCPVKADYLNVSGNLLPELFQRPNTLEPFYASLAYHINLALLKRKYRMLLCSTDYDRNTGKISKIILILLK